MKATHSVVVSSDESDAVRPPSYRALTAADLIDRAAVEAYIERRLPYGAGPADAIAAILMALDVTPPAGRC